MSPKPDPALPAVCCSRPQPEARVFDEDGTAPTKRVLAAGCRNPDGVAIDARPGTSYWTQHGVLNLDDGTIGASRSRRAESQDPGSRGSHVHAEAASSR